MRFYRIIEETIQAAVCLSCFTMALAVLWQFSGAGALFH
jgi:hypothetical protein